MRLPYTVHLDIWTWANFCRSVFHYAIARERACFHFCDTQRNATQRNAIIAHQPGPLLLLSVWLDAHLPNRF